MIPLVPPHRLRTRVQETRKPLDDAMAFRPLLIWVQVVPKGRDLVVVFRGFEVVWFIVRCNFRTPAVYGDIIRGLPRALCCVTLFKSEQPEDWDERHSRVRRGDASAPSPFRLEVSTVTTAIYSFLLAVSLKKEIRFFFFNVDLIFTDAPLMHESNLKQC